MRINEIMTRPVLTVGPQDSFKEAVDRLIAFDVSGLPVVDGDGRLVGIVTEADLVPKPAFGGRRRRLLHVLLDAVSLDDGWTKGTGVTVSDVMSTYVVVAKEGEEVPVVARRMLAAKVKRLPVVDSEHRLVGIVSRQDVLGIYLRPDPLIRDAVVEALADPTRSPEDADLEVTVVDGVVQLVGTVQYPSDVRVVEAAVWRVPGVVDLVTELAPRSAEPILGMMISVV